MKLSYNWLKDYLETDLTPSQVAEAMTSIGIEVDSVEETDSIPGGLAGVVVAKVLECEDHPDSDHLHVTKVDDGTGEPLTVVCGAPNVAAGQKVLFARIGAVLPGDFKIKKSKIRGMESFGMICAEDELGIGSSHDGIMVLEDEAVIGMPAKEYLHLETQAVIEYEITANRIDAASHIGVARDLYAYLKLRDLPCTLKYPDVSGYSDGEGDAIPVEVLDPVAAPRYTGTTIQGVKVAPSPEWLQKRLMAIGLKPINNIVDISNFVLFELGQPLHTFDADKIAGRKVIVRRAGEGEKLRTLDGQERTLSSTDIVIADANGPMCLGGVFGGEDSGVSDSTVNVLLESAYFDPGSIRRTSKKHQLQTDASFHNERGGDPLVTVYAAKRAADLIVKVAGGHVVGKMQEFCPSPYREKEIDLDYDRIEEFIGKKIGHDTIEKILGYLGYGFLEKMEGGARVAAPSYMVDVTRECDVVEEILRIYGYNNIDLPKHMKMSVNATPTPELSPLVYPQIVNSVPFRRELMHTPLHYAQADTAVSMITYYKDYAKPTTLSKIKKYTIGLPGVILKAVRGKKEPIVMPVDSTAAGEGVYIPRPIVLTEDEEKLMELISRSVSLDVDKKEGYLTLTVVGTEPIQTAELAVKAQAMLQDEVTRFRTMKAQDELDYIQARYDEVKKDAESAQYALARMTDRSQSMTTSQARIETERLQSRYNLANSIYLEMAKQLENAKMAVKKDTPTLSILQPITVPVKPSNSRAKTLVVWMFLGFVLGCGIVLIKDWLPKFKEKWNSAGEEEESKQPKTT